MISYCRHLLSAAISLLAFAGMGAPSSFADAHYDWNYLAMGNPDYWAGYFKANARIRLGREQRLPNGVSWRLLNDTGSGLAMPRLTWMPNRQRLAAANRLLDTIQGGDMIIERRQWDVVGLENDVRRNIGGPLLDLKHTLEQQDVGLTYIGSRYMSIMEAMLVYPRGSQAQVILRGLTFDLDSNTMAHVTECPDSKKAYGYSANSDIDNFLFRYGDWLQLCDQASYRKFIALVKETADRTARHRRPPKDGDMTRCLISPDQPLIHEEREYILYLTFKGLAVQVSAKQCPIRRNVDNPVIVPYRQLEPFLQPGPLRDELLK